MPPRKARNIAPEVVAALSRGERETRDLVEGFTVDFAMLVRAALPELPQAAVDEVRAGAALSYTKRMHLTARVCVDALGPSAFDALSIHPSDTVRGWACYAAGLIPDLQLDARLAMVRPLAAHTHFGVREWAWLGVRSCIIAEPLEALRVLGPWTSETDENLRRYASEATRPRGVWAAHIDAFKVSPEPALPLLEALRADPSRYVQDSVGNWLNDAGKSRPDWVRALCGRWRSESPCPATAYIARRGLRNI